MIEPQVQAQNAVQQFYEVIDSKELAKRLGLPLSWVQNHTRRQCGGDEIPHVKLGHLVRFEWGSPELYEWWNQHRKGSTAPPSERPAVSEERGLARGILRGNSGRERGARLAADVLGSRPN